MLDRRFIINGDSSIAHRFLDLSLGYIDQPEPPVPGSYPLEQIGLGFIAAMKQNALLDCEEVVSVFLWTYDSFPLASTNKLGINMASAASHPTSQNTRCNMMWALKTLPTQLIQDNYDKGTRFYETLARPNPGKPVRVYNGLMGDFLYPSSMEKNSSQFEGACQVAAQKRQTSSFAANSSLCLDVPGSLNSAYYLDVRPLGDPLPPSGIFQTVLESLMELAQLSIDEIVENLSLEKFGFLVRLYAQSSPTSKAFQLKVRHMILIVEGLARECVIQKTYKEVLWALYVDDEVAARGCLTKADLSRRWCAGLGGSEEDV